MEKQEGVSDRVVGLCSPQDERPRLVKHYQYFSWPDHGVPNEPGGVLSFLDQVNRAQRSIPDTGPIIVHCRYEPVGHQWGTAVGMMMMMMMMIKMGLFFLVTPAAGSLHELVVGNWDRSTHMGKDSPPPEPHW